MKIRIHRTLCSSCLFCLLPVEAAPRDDTKATPDFAQIDAYVQAQVQDSRIPGLALGIIQGDRMAHLHGFGEADSTGRAVTPHTPFLLGSTTKSFTALAMMQLVEAGKITLDVPVQRYLPWFRVADAVASRHITVRHLLNQVSGISTAVGLRLFTDDPTATPEQYVHALRTVTLTSRLGVRSSTRTPTMPFSVSWSRSSQECRTRPIFRSIF